MSAADRRQHLTPCVSGCAAELRYTTSDLNEIILIAGRGNCQTGLFQAASAIAEKGQQTIAFPLARR
jgi:hypothetical protein